MVLAILTKFILEVLIVGNIVIPTVITDSGLLGAYHPDVSVKYSSKFGAAAEAAVVLAVV